MALYCHGTDRWALKGIEKDSSEEPQLPKSYVAAFMSAFEQVQKKNNYGGGGSPGGSNNPRGSNSGSQGGGPKGVCWNCGKAGHVKTNCPDLKGNNSNNQQGQGTGNPKPTEGGDTPWYKVPPKDGVTTMKRKGRTYHWCTKCHSWRRHKTEEHEDWLKRQNKNKKNQRGQANVAETSEGASEGADTGQGGGESLLCFGGLSSHFDPGE